VDIKETLKRFRVRDILPRDFFTIEGSATLAKVLELIFHSHQEDFPVIEGASIIGFITRQDIMTNIHSFGVDKTVRDIMRKSFPKVKDTDSLINVQNIMMEKGMRALPVMKDDRIAGVITLEDIGRIYSMTSQRV
ncbi:MAG: CBS domain-containing protein, partial [Candidatus Omnitrophica bacterium]|nr:CBS domain-containing protein [Candidatus Omnitrophota bacterium]